MKLLLPLISCLSLLLCVLSACHSSSEKALPSATGGIGEVLVVCDNGLWREGVQKGLERALGQNFPMLLQQEPIFTFLHIEEKGFTGILKRNRKLIVLQKAEKNTFRNIQNRYAKPQVLFALTGKSAADLNAVLIKFKDSIHRTYYRSELLHLQQQIKDRNQSDDPGLEKMGVYLAVPRDYMHIVDTTGFQWFRKNTLRGFYNLVVYQAPWQGSALDDEAALRQLRDRCVGRFAEGSTPGSHMLTEYRAGLRPQLKILSQAGVPTVEMRGLWKMSGEFLGGTFLSYSCIDKKHKRIVTVEGFLFAPNQKKRDMMIELEAILKTFRLKG